MKKGIIRTIAFGLAATSIIAITSGDSHKENSESQTASIVYGNTDNISNYHMGDNEYLENNNIGEYNSNINIEDVVVIDTSKENDDVTLVRGEKKYYIVIPRNTSKTAKTAKSKVTYYETCDHSAFCAISQELGYVTIDNIASTFYSVYKPEGKLECISSLKNVLQEIGLEDCIQKEYTPDDLQILSDQINEKQKVMILS